jgi:ABC transporter substrate binding protein
MGAPGRRPLRKQPEAMRRALWPSYVPSFKFPNQQRESHTIPIVFVNVSDPIGSGFIESLARPGGNITGVQHVEAGIIGKWLTMLKQIAPRLACAGLLANQKTTPYDYFLQPLKP